MAISPAAPPASSAPPDPLAMWEGAPVLATALDPSFDVTDAGEQPLVWTLSVPADAAAAAAQIAGLEAALKLYEQALDAAVQRLAAVSGEGQADGSVSFDGVAAQAVLGPAESDLLDLLAESQRRDGAAEAEFGIAGLSIPHWEEVAADFQDFLERVRRFVAHYAWVETQVEGRLVARTTVDWLGDFQTDWMAATAKDLDLHRQALALALATRKTTLRIFLITVASAVKIAPMLATPGSAVLALPAVWRFINQIRSELEQIPQST